MTIRKPQLIYGTILLFIGILAQTCQDDGSSVKDENIDKNKTIELDVPDGFNLIKDTLARNNWLKDSLGCNHVRGDTLLKAIISSESLRNLKLDAFRYIFGYPNLIRQQKSELVLTYYNYSICENDTLIKGLDKCYLEFYFIDKTLAGYNDICE